ncbi:B12-binding domain-containing protein [Chloroflexota bacterium]
MSEKEFYNKLKEAMCELDGDKVDELVQEGMDAGITSLEIIMEGLSPGLTIIGDEYAAKERFMVDLAMAGHIMNEAMEKLMPTADVEASIAQRKPGEYVMVMGTVQGDLHNIGKRIVSAFLSGAGIKVIDIGEDKSADEFVEAIIKYDATIVGASAIIGPVTPYCKVIHNAMVDAGLRDKVIYICGGWGMTREWCDEVGADTFGDDHLEALNNIKLLMAGEIPKWKDRVKAN